MRSTHIPFLSFILYPNYINLNSYSYILSGYFFRAFLSITVINAAVNKYFGGVLGKVRNNLNTVIMYLFFYTGTRFSKG